MNDVFKSNPAIKELPGSLNKAGDLDIMWTKMLGSTA